MKASNLEVVGPLLLPNDDPEDLDVLTFHLAQHESLTPLVNY